MSQALLLIDQAVVVGFAVLALLAALSDWTRFRISNRISLSVAGLFVAHAALSLALGQPVSWLLWSIACGLAMFAVGFGLFAGGLLGGGDVKLMSGAALWAGPAYGLEFVLITTVAGALLGAAFLIPGIANQSGGDGVPATGPAPVDTPADDTAAEAAPPTRGALGRRMPYGLAIAVGSVAVALNLLNHGG
ncbi:MAG: prepilin peptidase [Rhodospirillales bacterium]|nr:MAG: prepilin peptidase [Rhodospirillales bacterium]